MSKAFRMGSKAERAAAKAPKRPCNRCGRHFQPRTRYIFTCDTCKESPDYRAALEATTGKTVFYR